MLLESWIEICIWCGNIGLCSGGILNEEYKMVIRVKLWCVCVIILVGCVVLRDGVLCGCVEI